MFHNVFGCLKATKSSEQMTNIYCGASVEEATHVMVAVFIGLRDMQIRSVINPDLS